MWPSNQTVVAVTTLSQDVHYIVVIYHFSNDLVVYRFQSLMLKAKVCYSVVVTHAIVSHSFEKIKIIFF